MAIDSHQDPAATVACVQANPTDQRLPSPRKALWLSEKSHVGKKPERRPVRPMDLDGDWLELTSTNPTSDMTRSAG